MRATLVPSAFLPLPELSFAADPWLINVVPLSWDEALLSLPGLQGLSVDDCLLFLHQRLAVTTRQSYAGTWKAFITHINGRMHSPPLHWHQLIKDWVRIHREFVMANLHSYHLPRITPVLNSTIELMTYNSGVAEVFIRTQRLSSANPRYVNSVSVVPLLRWCATKHLNLKELRLRLMVVLKLESLRRQQDLFNLLRSQIRFTESGVTMRVFEPKEIKNSTGRFGPFFQVPRNVRFPGCCLSTLLQEYMALTKDLPAVALATGKGACLVNEQRLFATLTQPLAPLAAATIGSLVTSLLAHLGIDGTSHILRGLAASHMLAAGATKETLLTHMNSSEDNFFKFYYRPPLKTIHPLVGDSDSLSFRLWSWMELG